jgi:hypothetical protein
MLSSSIFKYEAIFLAFLRHVTLSVDNITVACELFPMASYIAIPANFPSFRVSVV